MLVVVEVKVIQREPEVLEGAETAATHQIRPPHNLVQQIAAVVGAVARLHS